MYIDSKRSHSQDFYFVETPDQSSVSIAAYVPTAVAMMNPYAWPWTSKTYKSYRMSRKDGIGGPRINGWAYSKAYTRTMARVDVSGRNGYAVPINASTAALYGDGGLTGSQIALWAWKYGVFLPNQGKTVYAPEYLLKRAQTQLLVKLADRDVHLGNALGESRKTVSMIANRMISVLSALRALRRGNIRGAAKFLGIRPGKPASTVANQWLEWQYGWAPLLSDIYGGATKLQKGFTRPAVVRVVRNVSESSTDCGDGDANYVGTCSISVNAIAFYRVDSQFLTQLTSLGLLNPLEVAWELVPYSFVIDWFLPVGDWLTALTAPIGYSFIDGCFSCKAKGEFKRINIPLKQPPTNAINSVQTLEADLRSFGFSRIRMTQAPKAFLYAPPPLSTKRIVNALALLAQLKGR